jgi:hypothetical protein
MVNQVLNFGHTIVVTAKKEITALKKLGVETATPDCSSRTILDYAGKIGPLTRRGLAIMNLKSPHSQVAAALHMALAGEQEANQVVRQFPEGSGFILQEAFFDMRVAECLRLVDSIPASRVVELGMLLLSGHTLAFAIKWSDARAVMALGNNPYYVQKIQERSGAYIRKVNFEKATEILTSILPRIKRGHEPRRLLKSSILEILSFA